MNKNTTVWIVIYDYNVSGEDSIMGVFFCEKKAKEFIADYVLKNEIDTGYLYLFSKEVSDNY